MYCPQCGSESASSLQYCRLCGANLKVIGKAVALSEAIARSDRGPLPKIKEMIRGFKIEHVTEEISGALEKMNEEIARSSEAPQPQNAWWKHLREKKSPERRREEHRVKGTIAVFSGIAVTVFLYNLAGALVLKLPPDVLARIPFELDPVVHAAWTVGLIPTLSGLGHLVGSFFIKSTPAERLGPPASTRPKIASSPPTYAPPTGPSSPVKSSSVTEHTTNLLS
jgi:hypothetical protein